MVIRPSILPPPPPLLYLTPTASLASRCPVSSWLRRTWMPFGTLQCRSQARQRGLYISGDASTSLYLCTITHCCPADVTVSLVTVHRRQSYHSAAVSVSRFLSARRRRRRRGPETFLSTLLRTRSSQYRGWPADSRDATLPFLRTSSLCSSRACARAY